MSFKEIIDAIHLIASDRIVGNIAILIVTASALVGIFLCPLSGFIILTSYILGFVACWCLVRYQTRASVCLQRLASFYRGSISSRTHSHNCCGICTDEKCNRDRVFKKEMPWKNLKINRKLNESIEHFYNRLIENFITSWYSNITDDVTFTNELRFSLRHASASLANKVLEVDAGKLITDKLVPCAIKHLDDYLCMQQIAKLKNVTVNAVTVEYLGRRLHVAVTNRNNEINYLRQLTSCLMPNVLPEEYLKCSNYTILIREIFSGWVLLPLMDVLADPNIINSLVILIATYKPKTTTHVEEVVEDVGFLETFVNKELRYSSLALDLKSVLKPSDLLYYFMQFLKKEGAVHVLQFCLDVEAFNDKLIQPELSKSELENLHADALKLYKTYLNHSSPDFIGCSDDIVTELNELLQGGVYAVAKLRTSAPLFQSYDFAFGVLENEWLPQFYHSNEFYTHMCKEKATADYTKTSPNRQNMPLHGSPLKVRSKKYYEGSSIGTVARISSGLGKIRGALQSKQPIDGFYTQDTQIFENDATHYTDDVVPPGCIYRNLSTWKISIPSVDAKTLINSKTIHLFNVKVQIPDAAPKHDKFVNVRRCDQDFYTLKAKLIEFHGDNEISDSLLPSRRTMPNLESRRAKYEDFLKRLSEKPTLRRSDLLYMFLTSTADFTYLINSAEPSVDLENIYQSVALKLRKEKGQHLDSFMNTFLLSTGKSKQGALEWAELGVAIDALESKLKRNTIATPKTFRNEVFGNNYGVTFTKCDQTSSSSFTPKGITESIFYLLKHTFKVPHGVLKLYTAICSVAQQAFESLCRMVIDRKLRHALSQNNLAYLIGLLEGVLFVKKEHGNNTEAENVTTSPHQVLLPGEKKLKAFRELENLIPHYIVKILGEDFKLGCISLLEILQNPLYNKQLVYNLMDIIMKELYPQFDSAKE